MVQTNKISLKDIAEHGLSFKVEKTVPKAEKLTKEQTQAIINLCGPSQDNKGFILPLNCTFMLP